MRILLVVHQFFPEFRGGTENVAMRLAKAAQRNGHFVRLLTCMMGAPDEQWQRLDSGLCESAFHGIPITAFQRNMLNQRADFTLEVAEPLVAAVSEILVRDSFDVCHVMHSMRMVSAIQAIQNYDLPYVLTLTDFYLPCYRINLINQQGALCGGPRAGAECVEKCLVPEWSPESLIRRADVGRSILMRAHKVVCPSDYMVQCFQREYPGLDIAVIAHGIDLLAFGPPRRQLGSTLTFGYLGSIGPIKGVDLLVRAFSSVAAEHAKLELIGGFETAEFGEKIVDLVAGDPRIKLRAAVTPAEVPPLLAQFDVLCVPSVVPETFSLVLHEAAAAGTPALVSSLGAPRRYIEQHQCGRVVSSGDLGAWTEAIRDVCEGPERIAQWRSNLPLPMRGEEEAFFYQAMYRQAIQDY